MGVSSRKVRRKEFLLLRYRNAQCQGRCNLFTMMLAISLTAIAMIIVAVALMIGNIRSTMAFSTFLGCQQGRSISILERNKCNSVLSVSPVTLFANTDSSIEYGDDEEEDFDFSCGTSTDPPVLDWDLQSLLSSDPSMDARFIPLMNVYDAAATAAAENANLKSDDSYVGEYLDDNTPSHAPSILPSRTGDDFDSLAGPVQSYSYDGPLSPSVAPYRMFVREYNRDMGHNGRFTVFGEDRGEAPEINEETEKIHMKTPSLQSDVVFSTNDPLAFIRDNLSFGGKANKKGGEAVVYIPGLHTAHDPTISCRHGGDQISNNFGDTRPAPERLKYISQVLDGMPMAQIHAGTHIDQGNLDIELTSDTINSLQSFGLLTDVCRENLSFRSSTRVNSALPGKAYYRLRATDLDIIHTVLSRAGSVPLPRTLGDKYLGSDTKGLKDTLIRLIDIAVRSVRGEKSSPSSGTASPHLVLMTYSATSNVLAAALSEWKNRMTTPIEESHKHSSESEYTKAFCSDGVGVGMDENSGGDNLRRKVFSEQEAELLLYKALTVVTISSLSQGFVDGPAYIHVSMNDDPLTSTLGITKSNSEGGGKDSIILQALSPYLEDDEDESDTFSKSSCIYKNDAHNIDSCVIQYLSLVRRINGVTSFREMYNVGIADADSKKLDISASLFAVDYRSVGQLIIPPRIDCELIPAMIRATGGERWLWNPTFQLGEGGVEGFDSPLPSLEYAQAELENQLGYNSYDEIVEKCSR